MLNGLNAEFGTFDILTDDEVCCKTFYVNLEEKLKMFSGEARAEDLQQLANIPTTLR